MFELRYTFHKIAAQSLQEKTSPTMVICWADVVLQKVAKAAVVLAGGIVSDCLASEAYSSLTRYKEEEALRAAAQLPCTFRVCGQYLY